MHIRFIDTDLFVQLYRKSKKDQCIFYRITLGKILLLYKVWYTDEKTDIFEKFWDLIQEILKRANPSKRKVQRFENKNYLVWFL